MGAITGFYAERVFGPGPGRPTRGRHPGHDQLPRPRAPAALVERLLALFDLRTELPPDDD